MDLLVLIPILALIAVIAGFFAIFAFVIRRGVSLGQPPGRSYAPGWQARCPDCGATEPAGKVGTIVLVGFRQLGPPKTVPGWCDTCQKDRRWIVEKAQP